MYVPVVHRYTVHTVDTICIPLWSLPKLGPAEHQMSLLYCRCKFITRVFIIAVTAATINTVCSLKSETAI